MTDDVIGYSAINLTWNAYNFILITMPIICLLFEEYTLHKPYKEESYLVIIWILWGTHLVSAMCQFRINHRVPEDHPPANFDKDDSMKLYKSEGPDGSD